MMVRKFGIMQHGMQSRCNVKRKILLIVITIVLVFVQSTDCFAVTTQTTYEEISLDPVTTVCQQEMWHYSGGYWIVNAGTKFEYRITDKDLAGILNIKGYLQSDYTPLFINLPEEVISYKNNGDYVSFYPVSDTIDLSELFDEESFYGYIEDNQLVLFAKPILNLFGAKSMDAFIPKMNVGVPLVDFYYGMNLYSLYRQGYLVGGAKGAFYVSNTSKTVTPYLHPIMIKTNSGIIRNTYKISVNDGPASLLSNYYVGWGTFKDGGAVGCRFLYPIKVNFTAFHKQITYDYSDEEPDDPVIPPDPPVVDPPDDSGETTDTDDNKEGETTEVVSPIWRIHRTRNNL